MYVVVRCEYSAEHDPELGLGCFDVVPSLLLCLADSAPRKAQCSQASHDPDGRDDESPELYCMITHLVVNSFSDLVGMRLPNRFSAVLFILGWCWNGGHK